MSLSLSRFAQFPRLVQASENKPPLRQGENGKGVQALQLGLIDLGFPMPSSTQSGKSLPDGIFGAETAACVRGLQQSGGLAVDAVVGRLTLAELESQIGALVTSTADQEAVDTRKRARARNNNSLVD